MHHQRESRKTGLSNLAAKELKTGQGGYECREATDTRINRRSEAEKEASAHCAIDWKCKKRTIPLLSQKKLVGGGEEKSGGILKELSKIAGQVGD